MPAAVMAAVSARRIRGPAAIRDFVLLSGFAAQFGGVITDWFDQEPDGGLSDDVRTAQA